MSDDPETLPDSRREHDRQLIRRALDEANELLAVSSTPVLPFDAIPGYELIREIGRGGMGVVYLARQKLPVRTVALKVMLAGWFASATARKRFQREVAIAASFQHEGIVRLLECGITPTGQPFYTMDYVEGRHLDCWLADTVPDARTILELFARICDAVEHAHSRGIVHRDLKPGNILVDREGKAHILDFGLSKQVPANDEGQTADTYATETGLVVGTPRYLSPEQASEIRADVDARTDIYALGIMLYESLTGVHPTGNSGCSSDVITRIRETPPARPSKISKCVDRDLEAILFKTLEKNPASRYPSAGALAADLRAYLAGLPIQAHPITRVDSLRRWVRRRRLRIATTAALAFVGLSGLIGGVWWMAREEAVHKQAQTEALRLQTLYLQDSLDRGSITVAFGQIVTLQNQHPDLIDLMLLVAQAHVYGAELPSLGTSWYPAHVILRDALNAGRNHSAIHALLAEIYEKIGDPRAAEEREHAAAAPRDAESLYLHSLGTLSREKALYCAEQAASCDPRHLLAWLRLAHLRKAAGDYDGALNAADNLIVMQRDSPNWYVFKADIQLLKRDFPASLEDYAVSLAIDPNNRKAYLGRATVYMCTGNHREAIASLTQAIAMPPANEAVWARYKRATPLWITGQLTEAAQDYRDVIRLQGHPYACLRLVLVLCEQAHQRTTAVGVAGACQPLSEALVIIAHHLDKPNLDPFVRTIFGCLAGRFLPTELEDLAPANNPEAVCEAHYYAGEIHLLRGELEAARACFQRCLDTDFLFDLDPFPPEPMNEYLLARWRLDQLNP